MNKKVIQFVDSVNRKFSSAKIEKAKSLISNYINSPKDNVLLNLVATLQKLTTEELNEVVSVKWKIKFQQISLGDNDFTQIKYRQISLLDVVGVEGKLQQQKLERSLKVLALMQNQKPSRNLIDEHPRYKLSSIIDSDGVIYPEIFNLLGEKSEDNAALRAWVAKTIMPNVITLERSVYSTDNPFSAHIYSSRFNIENTAIDELVRLVKSGDFESYNNLVGMLKTCKSKDQVRLVTSEKNESPNVNKANFLISEYIISPDDKVMGEILNSLENLTPKEVNDVLRTPWRLKFQDIDGRCAINKYEEWNLYNVSGGKKKVDIKSLERGIKVFAFMNNQKIVYSFFDLNFPKYDLRKVEDGNGVLYPEILSLIQKRDYITYRDNGSAYSREKHENKIANSLKGFVLKRLMPNTIKINWHFFQYINTSKDYRIENEALDRLFDYIKDGDLEGYNNLVNKLKACKSQNDVIALLSSFVQDKKEPQENRLQAVFGRLFSNKSVEMQAQKKPLFE